jgi:PAS domain S-box-containing protein
VIEIGSSDTVKNQVISNGQLEGAAVSLDSVLCTEQLDERPSRPPNYQAEIQALLALVQELKNAPHKVLQRLVDTALELCRAHSSGISLLEEGPPGNLSPKGDHFRWHAVAGQWAPLLWNTTTRRDYGPCGTVVDRNCTLLFANAHRYFRQFAGGQPLLIEGLLVPFHIDGQAVGTVWIVAHDDSRKFDAEDRRVLESLATFAATAYQVLVQLNASKQQAEALRESEARFRHMADHAPVMIRLTEPDASCSFLGQSWYELTGQTPEAALGFGWMDVVHPEDCTSARETFIEASAKREAFRLEYRLRRKDGEYRCMVDSAVPRVGSEGRFLGYIGSVIDITDRKQAETANAFLAAIVRSSDDAIISKNLDGVITSWNGGAQQVFGYTAEEAIGQPVTILMSPEWFEEERLILERIRSGERIDQYETLRRHKDGTLRNISLTVSPVRDPQGRVIGASTVARDITHRKQAADKLRESEERFAQFMRHLPGLAWIKDAEGRYAYANDAAQIAFGTRPGELKGKTDHDLFPPETATQFMMNDQRVLACGSGIQTIETLKHTDGAVHHSIVSKFPIPVPDGKEIMIGGVAFDITEWKQAEDALRESEERFRLLAESSPVLIWVNGLDGCEFVNREYSQFVGRPMEEVQQMKWATALHPEDAEAYLGAYRRAFEARMPFEAQVRLRRADGQYRWVKSAGLPRFATDGRFLGYIGCSLDITDIRGYQEALSEADRRKNEFLAMLSHELRNPLATICNALEILRLMRGNQEAVQSACEMMDRHIDQMVRLVDDLLDVSRISRGRIELRTELFDLASAVEHAVETARPLCDSKALSLTVTLPPHPIYLNGDPIRLAQVVGNLLNNACKFTDRGGRIWLTAELATNRNCQLVSQAEGAHADSPTILLATPGSNRENEKVISTPLLPAIPHVVIRVRDTGIGIAPDQIPRIFEMFAQIDTSLERTRSGLGIGLTLAKNLVELHGGTLEVHSAGLGEGSEFLVRLPVLVQTPLTQEPKPAASGPTTTTTRRILVVEDNLDTAESLSFLLKLDGNETHAVYDGLTAVETAATFQPDVVLLDIGLPGLNGYDVANRIREQAWGRKMVLVALTGWGQEEDRRRSREAGFDHHLTKPVDPVALKKLLARLSGS